MSMSCFITFMAAALLIGIGCIISGSSQLWFTRRVQRKGMVLHGTIVERITRDNRGSSIVSSGYECEGKHSRKNQSIPIRQIDDYDRGRKVTVSCFPRHPSQARIWETSWSTRMILLGAGLILVILCFLPLMLTGVQHGRIR